MCGRFALPASEEIVSQFKLAVEPPNLNPRYNIAPSQDIAVVRVIPGTSEREFVLLKWGLVPFWANDKKIGYKMINARAESVADKPAFRAAFKQRRCLVPAAGFYEWAKNAKGKPPYFVTLKDPGLLAFAGIWEHWQGAGGEIIESCTIITTSANKLVREIHDRMPVIIRQEQYDKWLAPDTPKQKLLSFLDPFPGDKMVAFRVGYGVNNPGNDTSDCLIQIDEQ